MQKRTVAANNAASEAVSQARELIRPLRGNLRRLLQELVRVNSVAIPPHGDETPAQRVLRDFLRGHGFRPELYDVSFIQETKHPLVCRKRRYTGRRNLSVRMSGRGPGKSVLLNGHMDTVPPGKALWSASPWSGRFRDGRVYGRGAFDMKGGLVANTAVICALKQSGARLAGDVLFESVVDEEWGGGGGTLAARLRGATADACIIPEGTQLEIYRATRGGFIVDLIVDAGDPKGYFSKSEVVNPAAPLGRLLSWVEKWTQTRSTLKARGAYAGFADPAPVQVLAVEANGLDPSVPLSVPTRATVRVYFQFLPDEDVDTLVRAIEKSLPVFAAADPFFRRYPIQWSPLLESSLKGQELPLGHPWLDCLAGSAAAVMGRPPVITAAPYPCDAGMIQREFGIPTLLFGPAGGGAHNPDEYVEFDSVIQAAEVILAATLSWCGG
ncbi:MAG: M20/M25/M40 family metallo-hydrolase [Terracidiphilus sp.]